LCKCNSVSYRFVRSFWTSFLRKASNFISLLIVWSSQAALFSFHFLFNGHPSFCKSPAIHGTCSWLLAKSLIPQVYVYIINQLEPSNKTLDVRTHRENIHMKLIMSTHRTKFVYYGTQSNSFVMGTNQK